MGTLVSLTISLTIQAFFFLVQATIFLVGLTIQVTIKLLTWIIQGCILTYLGIARGVRSLHDRSFAA